MIKPNFTGTCFIKGLHWHEGFGFGFCTFGFCTGMLLVAQVRACMCVCVLICLRQYTLNPEPETHFLVAAIR